MLLVGQDCDKIHEPQLEKTNNLVYDQVRHKLACKVTEAACKLGI